MKKINDLIKCHVQKFMAIFYRIFWVFKINSKKIVCINFSGKGYGDSPKYIAEQIARNKNDFIIYWVYKGKINDIKNIPNYIKPVKKFSIKYFFCMATSKFWISNNRIELYISKRKNQVYIQTWHGGLALKKIEYDAIDKLTRTYVETIKKDNLNIDYMISNGKFCTEMYRKAFKYTGNILEIGTPRNDLFFEKKDDILYKVKNYYGIKCEKVLLYAPTFRVDYTNNPYDIDFDVLKQKLEENGDKWKILIRLHPIISNPSSLIKNFDKYINACDYPDIQELIYASDLIITDYSSVMFEGMIAKKPVLLYANDIDYYRQDRGYYFNFEELPFKIITSNNEFKKLDLNFYYSSLIEKYSLFCNKVGLVENGHASTYIYKLLVNIYEGEEK